MAVPFAWVEGGLVWVEAPRPPPLRVGATGAGQVPPHLGGVLGEGKLESASRKIWDKMLQAFTYDRNEEMNIPRSSCPCNKIRGQAVGGLDLAQRWESGMVRGGGNPVTCVWGFPESQAEALRLRLHWGIKLFVKFASAAHLYGARLQMSKLEQQRYLLTLAAQLDFGFALLHLSYPFP